MLMVYFKIAEITQFSLPNISVLPIYDFSRILNKQNNIIPFCVSCLNKYVTIWSNVAQHPVQTIVSATEHTGIGLHYNTIHTYKNPLLISYPSTVY